MPFLQETAVLSAVSKDRHITRLTSGCCALGWPAGGRSGCPGHLRPILGRGRGTFSVPGTVPSPLHVFINSSEEPLREGLLEYPFCQ